MNRVIEELLPKAKAGDIMAQEALAFAYVDQEKDYGNAVKWLEEAEKNGHLSVRGAWIIGVSYDDGDGVPKDADKAAIQAAKDAERQARWDELNRIDAEKRAVKEQKRLEPKEKVDWDRVLKETLTVITSVSTIILLIERLK